MLRGHDWQGNKNEVIAIDNKQPSAALSALTKKQKDFVREFHKTGNATQAVISAGYKFSDPATARTMGSENLAKPNIAAALAALEQESASRNDISVDMILQGLLSEARAGDKLEPNSTRVRAFELIGKQIGMWREAPSTSSSSLERIALDLAAARVARRDE